MSKKEEVSTAAAAYHEAVRAESVAAEYMAEMEDRYEAACEDYQRRYEDAQTTYAVLSKLIEVE